MKPRAGLLLVLFSLVLLQPRVAHAWYEKVHAYLVKVAAEIVKKQDQNRFLYEELYATDALLQMGRGAWREDYDAPVDGNSRAFRHYYDPAVTVDAVRRPTKGVKYYSHYRILPHLEIGNEVTPPPGGAYEGAMLWARDGSPGNSMNWRGALEAYHSGTIDGKREGYLRLGHALHLLGDMSEPDHATNSPHPGSGKHLPDDLSELVADNVVALLHFLRQELVGRDPSAGADLVEAFVAADLRTRTREYFKAEFEKRYSQTSVRLVGLEGLMDDCIAPSEVQEFFLERERAKIPPRVATLPILSLQGDRARPRGAFQTLFDDLARSAARQAVPLRAPEPIVRPQLSGVPPAIGCDHLGPPLREFVEKRIGMRAAMFLSVARPAILEEPLYLIPAINELDPNTYPRYVQLGQSLLHEAGGCLAALMVHFHDVVNEPPYVQEVRVDQSRQRFYRGTWKDGANVRSKSTGRTVEDYRGAQNPQVVRFYGELGERAMECVTCTSALGPPLPFLSGAPARIHITFGPTSKFGEVEIRERIDPQVKVLVDGKPVAGGLTGENGITWVGDFVPRLSKDERSRIFRIEVYARDLHKHHPRTGLPAEGYELDSNPMSVPAVQRSAPEYLWTGYTPGPDRNHEILVAQPQGNELAEMPPLPPHPEKRPPVEPKSTPNAKPPFVLSGNLKVEQLENKATSRLRGLGGRPPRSTQYLVRYKIINDFNAAILWKDGTHESTDRLGQPQTVKKSYVRSSLAAKTSELGGLYVECPEGGQGQWKAHGKGEINLPDGTTKTVSWTISGTCP